MSTEPNEAEVESLIDEVIAGTGKLFDPRYRNLGPAQVARFILSHFVRRSAILPEGMTVEDLRGYRRGVLQLGGTEYGWDYRVADHLLAICEGE